MEFYNLKYINFYTMQSVRNIAILAHVDAGKTTLSERILFASGEVSRPGKLE